MSQPHIGPDHTETFDRIEVAIQTRIREAVLAEREACAKLAESKRPPLPPDAHPVTRSYYMACVDIVEAICAR